MANVTVYKASAGSGKTFTLAVQYIRLLVMTNPQEYRHTLAVTFTNKATAEMKDRILQQLYGIGHALPDSESYMQAVQKNLREENFKISNKELRERCLMALRFILHDYSRFRIETIDSFFQSVLRNLAHELGLSARMQVDLNDTQVMEQAVDNLIDGLGSKDDGDILPWIDSYVKDQLEDEKGWDVRSSIKELAKIIFSETYMKRDDVFRQRINDEDILHDFRNQLWALKTTAMEALKEVANNVSAAIATYSGDIVKDVSNGRWILEYRDKMEGGDYTASITPKRLSALQEPTDLVKKADKGNTALIESLRPLCDAILESWESKNKCMNVINTVNLSVHHINPLRLLGRIDEEVTAITNDSNRFILARTPLLLSRLIGESDAPFVFEKMGTLFNHVMIDEFQDTSRLQWDNFKVLLLESQAAGGRDLIVGDVKQSIYRFRNGDWHILHNINNELRHNKPNIQKLDTNFRSDTRIIGFNNAFFTAAARELDQEGDDLIQNLYSDVRQQWPKGKEPGGYVRAMLKEDKCDDWDEIMLDDMCQQIERLHNEGLAYNKMAILVRKHKHTSEIIDYVRGHLRDVQLVSDEGFMLSSSVALNMMIAALKILKAGKSDLVAERFLVKHYLQDVLKQNVEIETYAECDAMAMLPESFVTRTEELRHYPLNELCEELFNIFALKNIKGENAYILFFFDQLAEYLRTETSDIHSFVEFWEKNMKTKSIPACQIDGISILTIHKSKGLQYHTVFMPFCEEQMEEVKTSDILWCESDKTPYNTLGALPINGAQDKFENSEFGDQYREEKLQHRIEELNSLYVAFTRAEHNLFIWGNAKKERLCYSTLIRSILGNPLPTFDNEPEVRFDITPHESAGGVTIYTMQDATPVIGNKKAKKEADGQPKHETTHSEVNRLSPTFEESDITFLSFNRKMDFRQSNEAERYIHTASESDTSDTDGRDNDEVKGFGEMSFIEQGKLLHEMLSTIIHADEMERTLQSYKERGLLPNESDVSRIRKLFKRALDNPRARHWFDGTYEVLNERDIVHLDQDGNMVTHRTDRVMLSEEEVIVVDFKFGRPNKEKYSKQVENYMNLLSQMYTDRTIKGYIWYVYSNKIEEV